MEYYKNYELSDIKYFCEFDLEWKFEQWKDVIGYEGHYLVSDLGRIKSVKLKRDKVLKIFINNNGYLQIRICKNGLCKTRKVHQIVAESFLGHIVNGFKLVVNHIDFNRKKNILRNLEILTTRENTSHRKNTSSSKYTGVTWCKNKNKWISRFYLSGKRYNLGSFDSEEEAGLYYTNALNDSKLGNEIKIKSFLKSSKHKGVYFNNTRSKWGANVYSCKKQNHLGWFSSEIDALKAVNKFKGTDNTKKVDDILDKI